jgi:hypothetical protein
MLNQGGCAATFSKALGAAAFHPLEIESGGRAVDSNEAFAFQMQDDFLRGFLR